MVEYVGIFIVEEKEIEIVTKNEKVCLEKRPKNFHCTLQYMPTDLSYFNEAIGQEITLVLTGYGCDGNNSGFKVQLPDDVKKYYLNVDKDGKLKVPHITTSLSKNGKAVNTMNLKFEDLSDVVYVRGKLGFFVKEEDNRYISFEKMED